MAQTTRNRLHCRSAALSQATLHVPARGIPPAQSRLRAARPPFHGPDCHRLSCAGTVTGSLLRDVQALPVVYLDSPVFASVTTAAEGACYTSADGTPQTNR